MRLGTRDARARPWNIAQVISKIETKCEYSAFSLCEL